MNLWKQDHIVHSSSYSGFLERGELLSIRWELWEIGVLLAAFSVAQFARMSLLPFMVRLSSSAGLTLSLLSADFYAVVAGIVFFHYKVKLEGP